MPLRQRDLWTLRAKFEKEIKVLQLDLYEDLHRVVNWLSFASKGSDKLVEKLKWNLNFKTGKQLTRKWIRAD